MPRVINKSSRSRRRHNEEHRQLSAKATAAPPGDAPTASASYRLADHHSPSAEPVATRPTPTNPPTMLPVTNVTPVCTLPSRRSAAIHTARIMVVVSRYPARLSHHSMDVSGVHHRPCVSAGIPTPTCLISPAEGPLSTLLVATPTAHKTPTS